MKAIILAAGYGNRMRPITDATHKTLLKIGDRTVIQRILDSLIHNGFEDIVIVTGYRAPEVKEHVEKNYAGRTRFQFINNPRYQETNNIYSLSLAFQSLDIDDDIILIESDLIYDPRIIERIIHSRKQNVALVDRFQSGMDGTVVEIHDDKITHIIPPHLQQPDFDFSDKYKTLNIYKFSREFCNASFKRLLKFYAETFDSNCYYELVLGMLIYVQKETIHAEILTGEKWAEIDDPNDLSSAKFIFDVDRQFESLEHDLGGLWNHKILDFCYIRNMYFPNNSIIAEIRNNLPNLLSNYGSRQDILDQKLAFFLLCNNKNIIALNGASQGFPLLREYFKGKKVLIPAPTFGEYPRIFGNDHTYPDEVGIDLSKVRSLCRDCDVIVFINPNNPTGSCVNSNDILKFALDHSNKTILVDESFIEFSDQPSLLDSLEKTPLQNIIVIKSLSKSLGIPGLRLGYLYSANLPFNAYIRDLLPIWNMNSMAEFFIEIILKHRKALQESFARTRIDRNSFIISLSQTDIFETVYPSEGNFILVKLKKDIPHPEELPKALLSRHSIYVKDCSSKFSGCDRYLRLAVRSPEENDRLIHGMKECCCS